MCILTLLVVSSVATCETSNVRSQEYCYTDCHLPSIIIHEVQVDTFCHLCLEFLQMLFSLLVICLLDRKVLKVNTQRGDKTE